MRRPTYLLLAALMLTGSWGCNRLSSEAKEMIGDYYITEVSEDEPMMELNADGTCVMRAIRPGVLTYSVPGKWNVLRDSLIVETRADDLTATGDTTLIGEIPARVARAVVDFNGVSLTLRHQGADYVYHRRGK